MKPLEPASPASPELDSSRYEEAFVRALFDRMGRTYEVVNLVSSLGFSEIWRHQCVSAARVRPGDVVADLMSGSGECWRYLDRTGAAIVSIDFSPVMVSRQQQRSRRRAQRHPQARDIDVRGENALHTSLADGSVDAVVAAFGLKTLPPGGLEAFAREIHRILKPGGRFSLLEISTAREWWLGQFFRWYLHTVIPLIGRVCLGDIECYRMLGVYTAAFGSCQAVLPAFAAAGLEAHVQSHFFGCASSLVGCKPPPR